MKALLFFILSLLMFGCSKTEKQQPIRLGVSDWPGWVAWYIGREKGFFKEANLDVELVWFNTYTDSINALATGQLDANSQTLSDTLPLIDKGIPLKIVLVNDNSAGNDAIVVKDNIDSISSLKGKKVAVELGAISHFFLLYILDINGLKEKDINLINMTTQDAAVAMIEGRVDAAVLWEPWVTKVVDSKKGKVLISSRETPGLIPDLLVAREDSLNKKKDEYLKLAVIWFKIVEFVKSNPEEASAIIAKVLNIDKEEVLKMMSGVKFFGAEENLSTMSTEKSKGQMSLYESGNLINKYLRDFKIISQDIDMKKIVDSSIVKNARKR